MATGSVTRRSLFRRGCGLLAAAIGVNLAGGSSAPTANANANAALATGGSPLKLYGRYWHSYSQVRRPGQLPARGDRLAVSGELLDSPEGNRVGDFYATTFCMTAPFGPSSPAAVSTELHTFVLSDGTLLGMGTTVSSAATAENVYAIVGGTGRYAGARGSYTARQHYQELEGDGTAEFALHLTLLDAA
jgi:hypothetical protein